MRLQDARRFQRVCNNRCLTRFSILDYECKQPPMEAYAQLALIRLVDAYIKHLHEESSLHACVLEQSHAIELHDREQI